MHTYRWTIMLAMFLSLIASAAFAQGSKTDKNAKIEELIKAVKMDTMIDQQIEVGTNQLIHQNPIFANHKTEILNLYHEILNKEEFNKFLVKLFSDNFSEEDIQALTTFYESPLGQRLLTKMPAITAASMEYSNEKVQKNKDKIEAVFAKITKESQKASEKPAESNSR